MAIGIRIANDTTTSVANDRSHTHNDGQVSRGSSTHTTSHTSPHVIQYDSTSSGVHVSEDAPLSQRGEPEATNNTNDSAAYRGSSQLSYTRTRLTTPAPPQRTHDCFRNSSVAFSTT